MGLQQFFDPPGRVQGASLEGVVCAQFVQRGGELSVLDAGGEDGLEFGPEPGQQQGCVVGECGGGEFDRHPGA
ncbi:hypothetical protein [Streptomyces pharetrae]|uniref:hypothetical protein n=1 Tax=Streptomyces pharetrae TaxID=291370 RepID=UPI00156E9530